MRRCFSQEQICAAYLADPLRVPGLELAWSSCDVPTLLKVLRQNKVPLLSLTAGKPRGSQCLLDDPRFQQALGAETEQLEGLRAEYGLVKRVLASEGIEDVMIKSVGQAPSFPYKSSNLDVLYRPEHVDEVRTTLCDLGYVELTNMDEPHKYLFRKFRKGRSVSAIHLHVHVGWVVSFLDEEALWRRREISDDDALVAIPAAEDGLLTTLAHCFYEDKCMVLADVLKLAHCLRRGVDWDEVYRVATWRGWRDGLDASLLLCAYQEVALYGQSLVPPAMLTRAGQGLPSWARSWLERYLGREALTGLCGGNWEQASRGIKELPLRIPFVLSKIPFYAKLVRDPTRSSRRKRKDVVFHTATGNKLRLRLHSQPRMLITFSGVDGCGKTTQAKALQAAFETCHLEVKYVWSRGGSARLVGLFTRWSKQQAGRANARAAQTTEAKVQSRLRRFRSPWMRWGWSWVIAIELLLKYLRHITLPLLCGRVVIADRYVYDTLADWAAYFSEPSTEKRLAARMLRTLSPRPQFAYWLDVSPGTARSRSADGMPEDLIAAQSAAYRRLAELYGLRRLDGESGWEGISDRVVHDVLADYFANYHTLINTFFLKNPGQWK
ncbi:MAG TPA: nucleotidyltransferase family protein [Anaerolineae bacterium]|nr:nucleotidyltransferase family protein [Anaerolineae bacterium]